MSIDIDVICPFCKEKDFDLFGLKIHFLNGWCEVFERTTRENPDGQEICKEVGDE